MTARVDPELADLLRGDPATELDAIVMATGRLDDLLASLPPDVTVRHEYRLIGSISVTAPAGAIRRLSTMNAVRSIERDRPVSHCADAKP